MPLLCILCLTDIPRTLLVFVAPVKAGQFTPCWVLFCFVLFVFLGTSESVFGLNAALHTTFLKDGGWGVHAPASQTDYRLWLSLSGGSESSLVTQYQQQHIPICGAREMMVTEERNGVSKH